MPRKPAPINRLPAELLCQVFDLLSFRQQLTVMATCVRWSKILSGDRYIKHRMLQLCPYNVGSNSRDDIELQEYMRRFHALVVHGLKNYYFQRHVKRFLMHEGVLEQLEELHLRQVIFPLSKLFATNSHELVLPKLKKLTFSKTWIPKRKIAECQLNAPNLKILEMKESSTAVGMLMQQYSEQIEDLTVSVTSKLQLLMVMGEKPFSSLTRLTLSTRYGNRFAQRFLDIDFDNVRLGMFGQLKYLKLTDEAHLFRRALAGILRAAKNLETLELDCDNVRTDVFLEIADLPYLKKLCVISCGMNIDAIRKLRMPQVQKLTTTRIELVRNVPKLRSLIVQKCPYYAVTSSLCQRTSFPKYFQLQRKTLKALRLESVQLDNVAIQQLCALKRLRVLELVDIDMEQDGVLTLFRSLKKLQRVRLVRCNISKQVTVGLLEHNFHSAEYRTFLPTLARKYVDCRISDEDNLVYGVSDWNLVCLLSCLFPLFFAGAMVLLFFAMMCIFVGVPKSLMCILMLEACAA